MFPYSCSKARTRNACFLDFNLENGCVQSQPAQWDQEVGVLRCSTGTTRAAVGLQLGPLAIASADELGSLLCIL